MAFDLLLPFLQGRPQEQRRQDNLSCNDDEPCLLIADENLAGIDFSGIDKSTQIISNRFDIAQSATSAGLTTLFNDFDCSAYPAHQFARICYRVSKEKAVVEHIIDQARQLLRVGGELVMCGAKNEGLKRYGSVAAERFGSHANIRKHGAMYIARIVNSDIEPAEPCAGSTYNELIPVVSSYPVTTQSVTPLYTKAGLFGGAKVDQGSEKLADYLGTFWQSFNVLPNSVLDLGCGYGYLSVQAAALNIKHLVATDNCAAAIDVCRANMRRLGIEATVSADDCAQGIAETFDAVLCNPPFHQGFKTDATLTEKFVRSAAQHLNVSGKALFVVNQFVPLEKIAERLFRHVTVVERDRSFKLVTMSGVKTHRR